jgi:hypothetical protein
VWWVSCGLSWYCQGSTAGVLCCAIVVYVVRFELVLSAVLQEC